MIDLDYDPQVRFFTREGVRGWTDDEIIPCDCCEDCNTIISLMNQEINNLMEENKRLKMKINKLEAKR